METKWAAMILLGAIASVKSDAAEKIPVDVYVQRGNWSGYLKSAETTASEALERSGGRVNWHAGELPAATCDQRRCFGIRMVERVPDTLAPGVLASARPFDSAGSVIRVYADRVRHRLDEVSGLSNVLLGYIFAHELAHVM